LEKEARRVAREKKRLEHEKRKAERKVIEASNVKAIEWKDSDKKDKKSSSSKDRKDKKRDKSEDCVLVVYDGDKKEKKGRKHRHHSSSKDREKQRKGSTSSESDSKAVATVPTPPLTPVGEDNFELDDGKTDTSQLRLPYNASVMSLAPALLQNVPAGNQTQSILSMGQQMVSMMDPDGDSPLTALLMRLTDILDTFDCLNASITTLVASLQKDPDALAMVGLTLAEISAIVAKTAPGVVVAAKAAFPVIFGFLASPQFLVTAGASVIIIGGYQIIRRVTGLVGSAPPTAKAMEEDDHLAFGPGMDEILSEQESAGKASAPDAKIQAITPAPGVKKDKKKVLALPPTPPLTPITETKKELGGSSGNNSGSEVKMDDLTEKPKLIREGSKRQAIKSFLTRANTIS